MQVSLAGLCHLGGFYGTAQTALSLPCTSTCREAVSIGGQHPLPSLITHLPHSCWYHPIVPPQARPELLSSALRTSQSMPAPGHNWATGTLVGERLSPWFVPNPMSSGAEPGEPAPVPGSTAGHGASSSRLQPKRST